ARRGGYAVQAWSADARERRLDLLADGSRDAAAEAARVARRGRALSVRLARLRLAEGLASHRALAARSLVCLAGGLLAFARASPFGPRVGRIFTRLWKGRRTLAGREPWHVHAA